MRIRKQYQVIPTNAKLENGDSTSETNGYTAKYLNEHSVVVSAVEPSGSARKKIWKQHSENVLFPTLTSSGTTISTSNCNVSLSGDEFTFSATGTDMLWGNVTSAGSPYYNQYGLLIPIPANATKVYLLTTNSEFNRNFVDFYNSNKSSLGYFQITNEVSIPANAKYVNVRIGKLDSVSGTTYKTKIQLSFNPITTYEPYVEDKEYILNNGAYEEFINNEPVVLYNNASGNNGTITLSDNVSNYDFLEIYIGFGGTNSRMVCQKVDLSISPIVNLFNATSSDTGELYFRNRTITISGNSISTLDSNRYSEVHLPITGQLAITNTNAIYIYKVIAYN